MVSRRHGVLFGLLALPLACAPASAPAPPPDGSSSAVRIAVDARFARLLAAYRRRDGVAFAAVYANDGVLRSAEGTLSGRSAIQADFTKGLASVISVSDQVATTEEFFARGDRAVQIGNVLWTETDRGKKPRKTRLDFALTWRRDADGTWRIARDLDAETFPEAPTDSTAASPPT